MTGTGANDSVPVHDHSGPDAGGETLRPADLATKETPRVDVRRYGVVGDSETDDADALQAAIDAATPRGVVHVPAQLDVYFESTIDVDLGADEDALLDGTAEQTPFALVCDGTLKPAAGIGDGVHVHHAVEPYVNVRIMGGGGDPDSDSAVHVTDALGGVYEGFATHYGGTVLTFTRGDTRLSGVEVGFLRAGTVGRELLMKGPADGLLGERGGVGTVEDVWGLPVLGMEFRNVRGLKIDQYENVVGEQFTRRGTLFEGCENVAIDKFAVGGNAELDYLVDFRNCRHLDVGSIFAIHVPGSGVRIDSVRHADFDRILAMNLDGVGVEYTQTGDVETGNNRVVVDAFSDGSYGLVVRESVTGTNHRFSGTMTKAGEPTTVESSEATRVVFHDATIQYGIPREPDLVLPEDNDVYLHDVVVGDIEGSPRMFNGVGRTAGPAETPEAAAWSVGDVVEYTDTDDGSGTGLYQLLPGGWKRLSAETADPSDQGATEPGSTDPSDPGGTEPGVTESSPTEADAGGFNVGAGLIVLASIALAAGRGEDDEDRPS